MNNKELALKAAMILDEKKAKDVVAIDVSEKSSFTDYLLIATGMSDRQVNALCEEVEDSLAEEGLTVRNIEGKGNSGWVLMDFGDIIVNLFSAEQRERYSIEKVWGDCELLEFEATEN